MSAALEIVALGPSPEVGEGDSLGRLIADAASGRSVEVRDDDVIVVSQKVVSKAEGRVRELDSVIPGERALELATALDRDPRLVELVLSESRRVVRAERGVLITETSSGWICANAGIDTSNSGADGHVTLLPLDPDESARRLRSELAEASGSRPGVVVSDSFGRPWRIGQVDVAIGCAGVMAVDDWRGRQDARGRELAATAIAVADQLAAVADLARDKTSRTPAVAVRGAGRWRTDEDGPGAAAVLQRAATEDLFR
jgi:coenzyme F420-0:L-glutamate ligase/coenzyme F420-1:gamma-L-glutamate ligase